MNRMQICVMTIAMACLTGLPMTARSEGNVVSYVEAKNVTNPPPSKPLREFSHFDVAPIAMNAPYAGQSANEDARKRIQADLDVRLQPLLLEWNGAGNAAGRTLRIEPTIRHIKFIGGGARFWGGAFAGGSAVLMTVKLVDASNGETIAEPEFYQHANAEGAAWSFGGTDKAMLAREATLITDYLKANRDQAVGGPTGKGT